jgi:3-oxoacyl-[acyl-carrier protein] reductase
MRILDRSVSGLAVLVTGAGSGIGRACAELFAREGASVGVTDYGLDRAQAVVDQIVTEGGNARAWRLDVADGQEIATKVAELASAFGRLDIVVNNAGVPASARLTDVDYEDIWDRTVSINLTAHQRVVRAALPFLKQSPCARIVNIASTEGLAAQANVSPYVATKTGVVGLTRAMAVELGRDGITANCICPGPIDSDMTSDISPEDKRRFARRRTAIGRYGIPEEIADMVLNFSLPSSAFLTGVALAVDGGIMARSV